MTKAQFTTALRRSFGDNIIKSQSTVDKLYDTYDFTRVDQMDWRAFLYMLTILMQPQLFFEDLIRLVIVVLMMMMMILMMLMMIMMIDKLMINDYNPGQDDFNSIYMS